jgi:hypothetical protein
MKHFPPSLSRANASGDAPDTTRRREPSAKQFALMNADQLKDYYQKRGEWAEPNWGEIADARKGGR